MTKAGELQAAVMDVLWAVDADLAVRDVLAALAPDRAIAYTTVMTVMERLFRKGLLTRLEDGKAFRYRPALSRADYTAQAMADALAHTSDRSAALVHFAEKVTPREARALMAALAARSGRRTDRP